MDKTIPEAVRDALRKAFRYGETYWQQADSGSRKQHKKAEETMAAFKAWADETAASFTAAQQQGQAVAWRSEVERAIERARVFDDGSDGADSESAQSVVAILTGLLNAQPMQQGGGEVLARGWLHRHGPGDDYDLHDESSGAGKDCAKCVPCVILRADTAPPSAPVGVDLEQFREAVMFWKGWAAIGLAVEKIGPFTLRQEEDVYQQRVNEADRLLALIDRASPLQACDCPAGGKRDPKLHAPNCPARLAQHQEPTT